MARLRIHDYANELRLEIQGRLSGESVLQISERWMSALPGSSHRKLTIDISGLTGFDHAGGKLLREMYEHGMQFSCGTPEALVFLSEISQPPKPATVTPIREAPAATPPLAAEERPIAWRARAQGSGKP